MPANNVLSFSDNHKKIPISLFMNTKDKTHPSTGMNSHASVINTTTALADGVLSLSPTENTAQRASYTLSKTYRPDIAELVEEASGKSRLHHSVEIQGYGSINPNDEDGDEDASEEAPHAEPGARPNGVHKTVVEDVPAQEEPQTSNPAADTQTPVFDIKVDATQTSPAALAAGKGITSIDITGLPTPVMTQDDLPQSAEDTYQEITLESIGLDSRQMGMIGKFLLKKAGWANLPIHFRTPPQSQDPAIICGFSGELDGDTLYPLQQEGWALAPAQPGLLWDFSDSFTARALKEDFRILWMDNYPGKIKIEIFHVANLWASVADAGLSSQDGLETTILAQSPEGDVASTRILQSPTLDWIDTISFFEAPEQEDDTLPKGKKKKTAVHFLGANLTWRFLLANALRASRDKNTFALAGPDHAAEKLSRGASWDAQWLAVRKPGIWTKLLTSYLTFRFKITKSKRAKLYDTHSPFANDDE